MFAKKELIVLPLKFSHICNMFAIKRSIFPFLLANVRIIRSNVPNQKNEHSEKIKSWAQIDFIVIKSENKMISHT